MAVAVTPASGHDMKWNAINRQLIPLGYTVTWMNDIYQDSYRYFITKVRPFERLGFYDSEATALAMAKLLVTEGGMDFPWTTYEH